MHMSRTCCFSRDEEGQAGRRRLCFCFFPCFSLLHLLPPSSSSTESTILSTLFSSPLHHRAMPPSILASTATSLANSTTCRRAARRSSTLNPVGEVALEEDDSKPGVSERFVAELDDCRRENCEVRFSSNRSSPAAS